MNSSMLLEFMAKLQETYEKACRPLWMEAEMSKTAFDILLFLGSNPCYHTAKDISTLKSIRANVVSMHVDELVKSGYLTRRRGTEDRRTIELSYTEKAVPLIQRGQLVQKKLCEELMDGLPQKDRVIFHSCMDKIIENVMQLQNKRRMAE